MWMTQDVKPEDPDSSPGSVMPPLYDLGQVPFHLPAHFPMAGSGGSGSGGVGAVGEEGGTCP